jgi:L-amino acid N-acyltransferase YncA
MVSLRKYFVRKLKARSWKRFREKVMEIETSGFSAAGIEESEEEVKDCFKRADAVRLIVKDGEKNVVGYLIAYPKKSKEYKTMYLSSIAVLPEHRGKGAGKKMMKRLISECKKAGYQRVTGHFLHASRKLFKCFGGRTVKEYPDWHGEGLHAAYMELFLDEKTDRKRQNF